MTGHDRPRKRLSANLPQHWLHDPDYWCMSDAEWRLHTHGLMWAIGRTDGYIPAGMLAMLLPGSDADRDKALAGLPDAGRWLARPDGWQIAGWESSQSTVEEIHNNRRREREKKARQRAVPRGTPGGESPEDVHPGSKEKQSKAKARTDRNHLRTFTRARETCLGCDRPARRGCSTCWDHAHLDEAS
jgi:hypothetical protein